MKVRQDLAHYFLLLINIIYIYYMGDIQPFERNKSKKQTSGTLNKYFDFSQETQPQNYPRRTYYAMYPNDIWQMDLIDMTNKGKLSGEGVREKEQAEARGEEYTKELKGAYKQQAGKGSGGYIMNVIDVYSRKAESEYMDKKNALNIIEALKKIFIKMGGKPKKIQTDLERSLWNSNGVDLNTGGLQLKKMGIELYNVDNAYDGKHSAPIVERLNKTMKGYMKKQEKDHPDKSNKELSMMVASIFPKRYNITEHSTIHSTPNNAFNGTTSTNDILGAVFKESEHYKVYKPDVLKKKYTNPKDTKNEYKIGDVVFIPLPTGPRGALISKDVDKWDRTPYKIQKIINSSPLMYIVNGNKYYAQQLRTVY